MPRQQLRRSLRKSWQTRARVKLIFWGGRKVLPGQTWPKLLGKMLPEPLIEFRTCPLWRQGSSRAFMLSLKRRFSHISLAFFSSSVFQFFICIFSKCFPSFLFVFKRTHINYKKLFEQRLSILNIQLNQTKLWLLLQLQLLFLLYIINCITGLICIKKRFLMCKCSFFSFSP